MTIVHAYNGVCVRFAAAKPLPGICLTRGSGTMAVQGRHGVMGEERVMSTSDIKFEALISSGFPELNRFRLKVHEVVMEPGDYPEHTHEGPGLRIVHDGAIEITQQGTTSRYRSGDYFFEGGHVPHTVKVPGPVAFRALYVEILPDE